MAKRQAKETRPLNINLRSDLWERIDRFRFQNMFPSRTEAIEWLVEWALDHKPKPEKKGNQS